MATSSRGGGAGVGATSGWAMAPPERNTLPFHPQRPLNFLHRMFESHGEFCGLQPWEVIVATLMFLVCFVTIVGNKETMTISGDEATAAAVAAASFTEMMVMTLVRCVALFHTYYRFKKVSASAILVKISALYLSFTWAFFILAITTFLRGSEALFDSWFLVLLVVDTPHITRMAQFVLSSSSSKYISRNLGYGMLVLGPSLTLDTLAKVLFFGVGLLTGIRRLELFAWYAVVAVMVHFLVYLTFYPACLSLGLDLMYSNNGGEGPRPQWNPRQVIKSLPKEEEEVNSIVIRRVRVIVIAILSVFHILCRRPLFIYLGQGTQGLIDCLKANGEQLICLVVVLILAIKYLFQATDETFETKRRYMEESLKKYEEVDSEAECTALNKAERTSNSTDEGISIGGSNAGVCTKRPRGGTVVTNTRDDSSSEYAWSEVCQEAQTTDCLTSSEDERIETGETTSKNISSRSIEECLKIMNGPPLSENGTPTNTLTDDEIMGLVEAKHIRSHALETVVGNALRGVEIRRKYLSRLNNNFTKSFERLPYTYYDYEPVLGACCENVVGYIPLPVGVVGPLKLDDKLFHIPMATTEGCLVASTNRGCSALSNCGVTSRITDDGMSRGPVVRFSSVDSATQAKSWIESPQHFGRIKTYFDSTSRFARLTKLRIRIAGRLLYLRFVAKTGDAMGMNMLSKATEFVLTKLSEIFRDMQIISISGNLCTDKKPAAINWIEGRGKSVVCEAVVPSSVLETTLKTTAAALIDLNSAKNQTGSALAGSIGGFNAHAANIVTAIFIATGQDAAQNIASSNCITLMEPWGSDGKDLYITCTMPSIEVGTVGGGTILAPQSSCLDLMGVQGPHLTSPGTNASQLARIICGAVLAGELSLMSALAAGHLVRSHLRHNRSNLASTLNFSN